MEPVRTITPTVARRLAVSAQRLDGSPPHPDRQGIMEIATSIRYLQLDPISVVARSHQLVLWSRLGPYELAELDAVLWKERRLFEYWAHAASIVMTEDYPIHHLLMRRYPRERYAHSRRLKVWVAENDGLRRHILRRLRAEGPLRARDLEDRSQRNWTSGGWTNERNVDRMLDYLWTKGRIVVGGRPAGQKLWALADGWFPEWTPKTRLPEPAIVRRSTEYAVRALGVARPQHIQAHFTRGRYDGLPAALATLTRQGRVHPVRVGHDGVEWPGPWYVHDDILSELDRLTAGEWSPRTTLLSPFDNLIGDRSRTELLFEFPFRMEIYVPKALRRYGYYVLPILHGDRLIGRIDPVVDRKSSRLTINSVHTEPDAPVTPATGRSVAGAVEDLARFVGAADIAYPSAVPQAWRRALS